MGVGLKVAGLGFRVYGLGRLKDLQEALPCKKLALGVA